MRLAKKTHRYGDQPSFYFAAVFKVPIKTPDLVRTYVAFEMVSITQDAHAISGLLLEIKYSYEKKFNENPIGSITIDQSEALLNAIHLSLNFMTVEAYNNACFKILQQFNTKKEDAAHALTRLTNTYNCYNHLVKNMVLYLKSNFVAHPKAMMTNDEPNIEKDLDHIDDPDDNDEPCLIKKFRNGFYYYFFLNILKLIANSANINHLIDVIWRNFCILTGNKNG